MNVAEATAARETAEAGEAAALERLDIAVENGAGIGWATAKLVAAFAAGDQARTVETAAMRSEEKARWIAMT